MCPYPHPPPLTVGVVYSGGSAAGNKKNSGEKEFHPGIFFGNQSMNLFINTVSENPQFGIAWLLVVVFSICCHEYAHALTAVKCGDDTPAVTGHLTLSPFRQMGMISLLMLVFTGIAWGSVPVNESKLGSRKNRILTAVAGPCTNVMLAIVFLGLLLVSIYWQWNDRAVTVFVIGAGLNLSLAVFNLLPVPPLDGFSVVSEIFPGLRTASSQRVNGLFLFLFILCFLFAGRIFDFCFEAVNTTAQVFFDLWL